MDRHSRLDARIWARRRARARPVTSRRGGAATGFLAPKPSADERRRDPCGLPLRGPIESRCHGPSAAIRSNGERCCVRSDARASVGQRRPDAGTGQSSCPARLPGVELGGAGWISLGFGAPDHEAPRGLLDDHCSHGPRPEGSSGSDRSRLHLSPAPPPTACRRYSAWNFDRTAIFREPRKRDVQGLHLGCAGSAIRAEAQPSIPADPQSAGGFREDLNRHLACSASTA